MYSKPQVTAPLSGAAAVAANSAAPKEPGHPARQPIVIGSHAGRDNEQPAPGDSNPGQEPEGAQSQPEHTETAANGQPDPETHIDIGAHHAETPANPAGTAMPETHPGASFPSGGIIDATTGSSAAEVPGQSIGTVAVPEASPGASFPGGEIPGGGEPSITIDTGQSIGSDASQIQSQPSIMPDAGGIPEMPPSMPAVEAAPMSSVEMPSSMPVMSSAPEASPVAPVIEAGAHVMTSVAESPVGMVGHTYLTFSVSPHDLEILRGIPGLSEHVFALLCVKTFSIWLPALLFAGICIISTTHSFIRLLRGERRLSGQRRK